MVIRIKNFIPRKCSISFSRLEYWLTIPEFVTDVIAKIESNVTIDDEVLLNIMQGIYNRRISEDEGFDAKLARRAINSLKKACGLQTE